MRILYLNTSFFDYLTATLIEGLTDLGHEVWCVNESCHGRKLPPPDLPAYGKAADIVVVGTNAGVDLELARAIDNRRKVYVDGTDYLIFKPPEGIDFALSFKREYCAIWGERDDLFPLPFAAERRYLANAAPRKDILVSFMAEMTHNPIRASIHERLTRRDRPDIISGFTRECVQPAPQGQRTPTPIYHQILGRSLISVNAIGGGYDCARYWEILGAQAMLFTQHLDIVIPHPFTDGVDCVVFKTLEEFEDKLEFYLKNTETVQTITRNAQRHLMAHHTTTARSQYFLDICGKHLDLA